MQFITTTAGSNGPGAAAAAGCAPATAPAAATMVTPTLRIVLRIFMSMPLLTHCSARRAPGRMTGASKSADTDTFPCRRPWRGAHGPDHTPPGLDPVAREPWQETICHSVFSGRANLEPPGVMVARRHRQGESDRPASSRPTSNGRRRRVEDRPPSSMTTVGCDPAYVARDDRALNGAYMRDGSAHSSAAVARSGKNMCPHV